MGLIPAARDAFASLDAICAQPQHLWIGPGRRHVLLLRSLCDEGDAVGDLVADAAIAAIAAEHSATVVTLDLDFARFPSVAHTRPAGT